MSRTYRDKSRSKLSKVKFRPQSRHYNDLFDKVKEYVLTTSNTYIRKEEIARIFKAKNHEVEQCLQKLNLEGIVSQPIHHAPHDSKRDPYGFAGGSDWCADIYKVKRGIQEKFEINENGEEIRKIKGRLFLSNIKQSEIFANEVVKLFIAREPIKDMDKYNFKWITKLVPSYYLLNDFKNGNINFNQYKERYRKEVILNPDCKLALSTILNHLKNGEDIALICYCQSSKNCHRIILGEYFEELGVDVLDVGKYYENNHKNNEYDQYSMLCNIPINEKTESKIINQIINDIRVLKQIFVYNQELVLNNHQVQIVINKTIKEKDQFLAECVIKRYENQINRESMDQLQSLCILKKLLE